MAAPPSYDSIMAAPPTDIPRIEDYGLIGDRHTAALVGKNGSIDFMCFPKFDSPTIFGRLLDTTKGRGGHWSIRPKQSVTSTKQFYRECSNILQTKFISAEGVVDLTDFLAVSKAIDTPTKVWRGSTLVRKVTCVRGRMTIVIEIVPQPGYAEAHHTIVRSEVDYKNGVYHQLCVSSPPEGHVCDSEHTPMLFQAIYDVKEDSAGGPPVMFEMTEHRGSVIATFDMHEGQEVCVTMSNRRIDDEPTLNRAIIFDLEDKTYSFWTHWIRQCSYRGRFQQEVERCMLILKLLTYKPTGAIVAAPTFSLPEAIRGGRNWDYRYSWVRDSSFTVYVFLKMGFIREAEDYMSFIFARLAEWRTFRQQYDGVQMGPSNLAGQDLQKAIFHLPLMFSIDGKTDLPERELSGLAGYLDSAPVRVGNAATGHVQLDIYGELMDAIYLFNKYGKPVSYKQWLDIRELIDFVCTVTKDPDMSIWEVRGGKQHFVYSKIMLWVAIDRGLRLVEKRNFPCPSRARWLQTRDELHEEIMTKGFNAEKNTFIQSYEDPEALDSAVLIAPLVLFINPNDPQFLGTLDAVLKSPEQGGLTSAGFVYRYDTSKLDDGVGGEEGAFVMCTLWLIEALVRAGKYEKKYMEQATRMFETVTNFRNHVGMLSEEISISGEQLGNTPQAFSHLAYVSAALNIERVRFDEGTSR